MTESRSVPTADAQVPQRKPAWLGAVALFVVSFVLYAATANRGPQWQDSGLHMYRIAAGELVHPLGLALSHPLHYWLGRLLIAPGLVEPSFATTSLSSFAAAIAVACVFGCVVTLTSDRRAGLFAAGSLALAHTFWQMATRTETYSLTSALLAAECWAIATYAVRRTPAHLVAAFLCNGLGVANHLLAGLTTPVLGVVLLAGLVNRRIGPRHGVMALSLWVLGAAPYWGLVVQQCMGAADTGEVLHSAFFGRSYAGQVLNTRISPQMLGVSLLFILLNLPNLLLPHAAFGLASVRFASPSSLAVRVFLAALGLHGVFVLRYNIPDQYTFFLPLYVLLALFGGIGAAYRWVPDSPSRTGKPGNARNALLMLLLTPMLYALVPSMARRLGVLEELRRDKPYRDDYVYLFTPWTRADASAERMADHAVELAGHDGLIVVEEPQAEGAIRYSVLRQGASGLEVTTDEVPPERLLAAWRAGRRVVLVPQRRDAPQVPPPLGRWMRDGDLYVLSNGATP